MDQPGRAENFADNVETRRNSPAAIETIPVNAGVSVPQTAKNETESAIAMQENIAKKMTADHGGCFVPVETNFPAKPPEHNDPPRQRPLYIPESAGKMADTTLRHCQSSRQKTPPELFLPRGKAPSPGLFWIK